MVNGCFMFSLKVKNGFVSFIKKGKILYPCYLFHLGSVISLSIVCHLFHKWKSLHQKSAYLVYTVYRLNYSYEKDKSFNNHFNLKNWLLMQFNILLVVKCILIQDNYFCCNLRLNCFPSNKSVLVKLQCNYY